MSATNYTPIYLYNSGTATNTPSAANLGAGELAINYADGKLFYKDGSAAVQVIGWKTTPTTAGGTGLTSYTAGDLPYYASGSALSKLAIGSANYVLTSSGTAPQYVAQSTLTVGNATNAINVGTTDNTSSSSTYYPTLVSATSGNNPITTSSTKLSFVPSTGTLTATSHAGAWAGSTIGTTYGGTGQTSYAVGDLLYADTTTSLAKLADVATGNALISGGVSTAPSWGKIGLTTHVSGVLPVANGGTGLTTLATGYIPYGNGTSAFSSNSNFQFNSGKLFVGTTSLGLYSSTVTLQPASNSFSLYSYVAGTGTVSHFGFENGNGIVGQIYTTGTTTVYSAVSDYRLKNNPIKINTSGDFIDSLNPVTWTWTTDNSSGSGFLAHEFSTVSPSSVIGKKDEIQDVGNIIDSDGKNIATNVTKPSNLDFGQTWIKIKSIPIYQQMDASSPEMIANIVAELQSLRARLKAANIA